MGETDQGEGGGRRKRGRRDMVKKEKKIEER